MTKNEVIERLCYICTEIGDQAFNNSIQHDCFCGEGGDKNFQFDEEILSLIENAVEDYTHNKVQFL